MKFSNRKNAVVLLADGTLFHGKSIGVEGSAFGEICFSTGSTGYQEVMTDPSYHGQIMVSANAQLGNYGTTPDEVESQNIQISGQNLAQYRGINHLYQNRAHNRANKGTGAAQCRCESQDRAEDCPT